MNDGDPVDDRDFERERELTGMYRDALDAFAEDARRIVREEVAAAQSSRGEAEDLVRRGANPAGLPWTAAALAATIVITALGAAWGVVRLAGPGPADTVTLAGTDSAAVGEDSTTATESTLATRPAPATPRELAARFDSLFDARDDRLAAIVLSAASPSLAARVDDWALGRTENDLLVHNILVQLALRAVVDSTLTVDGAILRRPECRGETCGALLAHWRAHQDDPRYPPLGAAPAADGDGIALVERVLVLRHGGVVE